MNSVGGRLDLRKLFYFKDFFSWERETDRERGQDPQWEEAFSILAKIVHPKVFKFENAFSSEWQRHSLCLGNVSTGQKLCSHNSTDSTGPRSCSSREFAPPPPLLSCLTFFPLFFFFNIPPPSHTTKFLSSAFELRFSACLGHVRSLQSSHWVDQTESSGV